MRKLYKAKVLALCLMLFSAVSAFAVPAITTPVKVKQADGSELTIKKFGDEFFNWTTTLDGYNIAQKNGVYYYLNVDPNGKRVISNQKVNQVKTAQEVQFLATFKNADMASIARSEAPMMRAQRSAMQKVSAFPNTGKVKSVVLLVEYKDVKFELSEPKALFTKSLNEKGYKDNDGTGSAKDYYEFNAGEYDFTVDFDVYGPYTLSENRAYYGAHSGGLSDARPREMMIEAVRLADGDVDFSQYDFDNDGQVDNVFVYYAGHNEAEGGPDESIWPHKWTVNQTVIVDGKQFSKYACSSELRGASGKIQAGIGTFCHEFGHVFGLPDFYDTSGGNNVGMGSYDVMTGGSYNNKGCTPPPFNAYQRAAIGWTTPILLDKSGVFDAKAKLGEVYRVNTDVEGEYFLIENKQKSASAWDAFIPGSGVAIMHIDRSAPYLSLWDSNGPNTIAGHQCAEYVFSPKATVWADIMFNDKHQWTPTSEVKNVGWSNKPVGYGITKIEFDANKDAKLTVVKYAEASISGKVVDDKGKAIVGANVYATTMANKDADGVRVKTPEVSATTNAKGEYVLNVKPSSYAVTVYAENYDPIVKSIVVERGPYKLDFTLASLTSLEKVSYNSTAPSATLTLNNGDGFYSLYPKDMLKAYVDMPLSSVKVGFNTPCKAVVTIYNNADKTKTLYTKEFTIDQAGYLYNLPVGDFIIKKDIDYLIGVDIVATISPDVDYFLDNSTTIESKAAILKLGGTWTSVSAAVGSNVPNRNYIELYFGAAAPTSIVLKSETMEIPLNAKATIEYGVTPASASKQMKFMSENSEIATVDAKGNVTTLDMGETNIIVSSALDPDVKAVVKVKVTNPKFAKLGGSLQAVDGEFVEGALLTFIDYGYSDASASRALRTEAAKAQKIARADAQQFQRAANSEIQKVAPPVSKSVVTDKDGRYSVEDLYSTMKYLIQVNPSDKYLPGIIGPIELFEGQNPDIDIEGLPLNPAYGLPEYKYHKGIESGAIGSTSAYLEYGIRLKKEDLKGSEGHLLKVLKLNLARVGAAQALVQIYYEESGFKTSLDTYGLVEIGNGLNIIDISDMDFRIPEDQDVIVSITMRAQVYVDQSNLSAGYGNLVFDQDKGTFVELTEMDPKFVGSWHISTFLEEAQKVPALDLIVTKEKENDELFVGLALQLKFQFMPVNVTSRGIVWTSSDEKIATVDANGLVKGVSEGEVTIKCTSAADNKVFDEVKLNVGLKQIATGVIKDNQGAPLVDAKVLFIPIVKSVSNVGQFARVEYQDVVTKGDPIVFRTDDKGTFVGEVIPDDYRVEVSAEGCSDLKQNKTVVKGYNEFNFVLESKFASTAVEYTYSDKVQKNAVGAGGGNFGAFAKWTPKELEKQKDSKITRITLTLNESCKVTVMVLIDGDISKPLYTYDIDHKSYKTYTLDLKPDEQVAIPTDKDLYVGYVLTEYADGAYPASTGSNPTNDGLGNMLYMNGAWQTLKSQGLDGNWMVGFHAQTDEQIKGVDIAPGQIDARLGWNASGYKQFRVSYNEKGGVATVVDGLVETKYNFVDLKPATEYEYLVEGIADGAEPKELVKSKFTTIAKLSDVPMVLMSKNTYAKGEVVYFKVINIAGNEVVTWYVNDVEQQFTDTAFDKTGEYIVKCKVARPGRTLYTIKKITVQ